MKKLPKIYQGDFDKKINNNKNTCYLDLNENVVNNHQDKTEVLATITELFSGLGHAYNTPLIIRTNEKVYETSLISKTKHHVVTLDNEVISIPDIISIKKNI